MNRSDLQSLSRTRLAEAKTLLDGGFPDGAYYLAGYAVEFALKACIAKRTHRHDFPDKKNVDASYTHNLSHLVRVVNLEIARLAEANRNPAFRNNWDLVKQWAEQSRYRRNGTELAQALIGAIDNRRNGVIVWIKRYW